MIRTLTILLLCGALMVPLDKPPQCDQPVFARNNPGLCSYFPFPNLDPRGGGGSDGGLLGGIGRVLHGLSGLL